MRRICIILAAVVLFCFLAVFSSAAASPVQLKLLVSAGYLPQVPLLVRVEALNKQGAPERGLWNGEVVLSTDSPGVTLSTNQLILRNGIGSALVLVDGSGDFTLTAVQGALQATRFIVDRSAEPVVEVGGSLPGEATIWSGIVLVTNDVTVPTNHTLTILSNTMVLLNGVSSGNTANDLLIAGNIQSLGTESYPVTITCAQPDRRWGQIRHNTAMPSLYQYTTITRAGRGQGEGHTGTTPVIRPTNSKVTFEHCSLTDLAELSGTPGKVAQANGSDLTFVDCLFQRARMGPEISGSALACTNTWILDMNGPDDADGIYLHDQAAGQEITLSGCVLAAGGDDGIDTLGAVITVEDCIVRDWNSVVEDAKGISAFSGATHVLRSLIVDCTVGIAAKTSASASVLVTINNSTLYGNLTNVLAQFKGNAPGPRVDYRITNSIMWGVDSVQSDFAETNFTIRYCNISEPWPGDGNIMADPMFVDAATHDFRLRPYSPSIDSGDPASALDSDSSPADQGFLTFIPPPPVLSEPQLLGDGTSRFLLTAYTNRSYVIDASTDAATWAFLKTVSQQAETNLVTDLTATGVKHRFYRARLAP